MTSESDDFVEWVRVPHPIADHVPMRLRLAWNCLRGRPVAYRLTISGGLSAMRNTMVVGCTFQSTETGTTNAHQDPRS